MQTGRLLEVKLMALGFLGGEIAHVADLPLGAPMSSSAWWPPAHGRAAKQTEALDALGKVLQREDLEWRSKYEQLWEKGLGLGRPRRVLKGS